MSNLRRTSALEISMTGPGLVMLLSIFAIFRLPVEAAQPTCTACPQCATTDPITYINEGRLKDPCEGKKEWEYPVQQSKGSYYKCVKGPDGALASVRIECGLYEWYNPQLRKCVPDPIQQAAAPALPQVQLAPGDQKIRCSVLTKLLDAWDKGAKQIVATQKSVTNKTTNLLVKVTSASRGKYNKTGGFDCGAFAVVQLRLPISSITNNGQVTSTTHAEFKLTVGANTCNNRTWAPPGTDVSKNTACTVAVGLPPGYNALLPLITQYLGGQRRATKDCTAVDASAGVVAGVGCGVALALLGPLGLIVCGVGGGLAGAVIGTCPKSCFPGAARVARRDEATGTVAHVPVAEVREGDDVAMMTGNGRRAFSKVVAVTHKFPDVVAEFVELAITANVTLRLTPDHMLPVGLTKAMARAATVQEGNTVWVWDDVVQAIVPAEVVAVRMVSDTGVFNLWVRGGTIIVDGVVLSCYSAYDELLPAVAVPYMQPVSELVVSKLGPKKARWVARAIHALYLAPARLFTSLV